MLDGLVYLICELYIDDVRRRRHVRQQRETQNYYEPEENGTWPRRGRISRSLSELSFTKEKRQKIQKIQAATCLFTNEVGLAPVSNRVVTVSDEELVLVEMQYQCHHSHM